MIRLALKDCFRCSKGALVVVLFLLILAAMPGIPIRNAFYANLGNSMAPDRLMNGIDMDVLLDMGAGFKSIFSLLSGGLFIAFITGIVVNSFVNGGLFSVLRNTDTEFTYPAFFRDSAKRFFPFLIISVIFSLIILVLAFLIIVVPVSIVITSDKLPESAVYITGGICLLLYFVVSAIVLTISDQARAWQVSNEENNWRKAFTTGFRFTFRNLRRLLPVMLFIILIQIVFTTSVLYLIAVLHPSGSTGVFLMFLFTQLMLFIRILIRMLRYAVNIRFSIS